MTQQGQPERRRGGRARRLAMTIRQFAAAHGFSQAMYFKEKKAGRGPREFKVGRRTFITFEPAAKWRAEREAASNGSEKADGTIDDTTAPPMINGPTHFCRGALISEAVA